MAFGTTGLYGRLVRNHRFMRTGWLCCLLLILSGESLAVESIALISDLNGRYGSDSYHGRVEDAIGTIIGLQPDMVISTGDMVAGQQQPRLHADWLDRMWLGFTQSVTDPLTREGIPLLVTPGNHDGSAYPEFALEQKRFASEWASRKPEVEILPGSDWPRRYAARKGTVLLVAFDGTLPGALPATERRFIEKMLLEHGSAASATLVYSHLPMWPVAKGREHEIINDPALLALLHQNGVDIYAGGHHHAFFAGTDDAGMIHISNGALGGNARAFSGEKQRQPHSFTIVTLTKDSVNITSRAAPGFVKGVPVSELPATIKGPLGTLQRIEGPVPLRP